MVIPLICFIYRRVSTITKKRFCNAGKKEYAILWIGGIDWIFSSSPAYFLYLFF